MPNSPYGESKLFSEQVVRAVAKWVSGRLVPQGDDIMGAPVSYALSMIHGIQDGNRLNEMHGLLHSSQGIAEFQGHHFAILQCLWLGSPGQDR